MPPSRSQFAVVNDVIPVAVAFSPTFNPTTGRFEGFGPTPLKNTWPGRAAILRPLPMQLIDRRSVEPYQGAIPERTFRGKYSSMLSIPRDLLTSSRDTFVPSDEFLSEFPTPLNNLGHAISSVIQSFHSNPPSL